MYSCVLCEHLLQSIPLLFACCSTPLRSMLLVSVAISLFALLQYHLEIYGMEKEMAEFNRSASLFEVNLPDFKQLKQCRKEIVLLKQLWDYVFIVTTSIADWKTMPWSNIDCEQMELDCKKFAKDIRGLDKEMRAWDTYLGVEGVVKNMITSLRAVAELQNNAIRDRHWQQLMKATGVRRCSMDNSLYRVFFRWLVPSSGV